MLWEPWEILKDDNTNNKIVSKKEEPHPRYIEAREKAYQLESTIEPLLISWKKSGLKGCLGDHVHKIGEDALIALLYKS